jgi:NAD-dependent deacetylase
MPNPGHHALVALEEMGILKCVITQNTDGLHEKAGTQRLLEYHGSGRKLRCIACNFRFPRDAIDLDQLLRENRLPPRCPQCQGVVKSDGVGFGEPIPSDVAQQSLEEALNCDLMLICGTSAVVYPFANLPRIAKQRDGVTVIEVNAVPTPLTQEGVSDYFLQGKTGVLLPSIVEEVKRFGKYGEI